MLKRKNKDTRKASLADLAKIQIFLLNSFPKLIIIGICFICLHSGICRVMTVT